MNEEVSELRLATEGFDDISALFARRVLVRQFLVVVVTYLVVAILAPWALILEPELLLDIWLATLQLGVVTSILAPIASAPRVRRARHVVRALAIEPSAVSADDIGVLADLPFNLTARFGAAGVLAAAQLAVPGLHPTSLEGARAISFALFSVTLVGASAVAHYVAVREATIRTIELSPPEPLTAWLERESLRMQPSRRVARRLLLVVAVPAALVGVGATLLTHAHLRSFVETSRADIARKVTAVALEPAQGANDDAGRDDAVAAAAAHGFFVKGGAAVPDGSIERLAAGQSRLGVELEGTTATVRYEAQLTTGVVTTSVWLTLIAVLLAGLLGGMFGRALAADLVLATRQVSSLGAEEVIRGRAKVAGPARFEVVARLGRGVEALAERFRIFAAAQERALEAKVAAQRMKQLLFASVSHDLKSPLNAILGFAELVREEPLLPAQVENLDMVSTRGRELLALIETILDAARVEAGQLSLHPESVPLAELVDEALAKARDLHVGAPVHVVVDVAGEAPDAYVDPVHAARAVGVMVAHAMEMTASVQHQAVRIQSVSTPRDVQIRAAYHTPGNRPSLLEQQFRGRVPTSSGRGMVLRLSLARVVVEMHRGSVSVHREPSPDGPGPAVVVVSFPRAP